MSEASWVTLLARPAVRDLKPYSSARSLVSSEAGAVSRVYLDANEYAGDPDGTSASRGWNRYPEPQPQALKKKLMDLYGAKADEILLTRGSDESIDCLSRAFLSEGKDSILICPPTYGVYEVAARLQGGAVVEVPLQAENGFQFDEKGISKVLKSSSGARPKLVYLCSPNNPTGAGYEPRTLLRIAKAAEGTALVVVDEAYVDFSEHGSVLAHLGTRRFQDYPGLVVLRTLSKAWGLAGIRIGAAIAHPETRALLLKTLAPYPIPTPSIQAAISTMEKIRPEGIHERVGEIISERSRVEQELRKIRAIKEVLPSEANFLLFRSQAHGEILKRATSTSVILRDRSRDMGLSDTIRMTIGTRSENDLALKSIREACDA